MNRDTRNWHYLSFGNLHEEDGYSSMNKKSSKRSQLSPRHQLMNLKQQLPSMVNYSSQPLHDSLSFSGKNFQKRPPSSTNCIEAVRYSQKQPEQNQSTYQHSQRGNSINGSDKGKSYSNLQQSIKKQSGLIYQEIIRVLEGQNRNLKQQNKYIVNEYRNIVIENHRLKQQIQSLKGYNNLKLQLNKVKQINQTYEKLVQELKFILMQQMVAIHQKINFIMSSEDITEVYNQFEASLKKSTFLLNSDNFMMDQKHKDETFHRSFDGMNLTQMLSIHQDQDTQKQQIMTLQTFQSMNCLHHRKLSKQDIKLMQSPTQTTFSGQLKQSD